MSTQTTQPKEDVRAERRQTWSRDSGARIPELDGLRGTAILLVILCHYVGNAEHAPLGIWLHRILAAFTAGWSGVDLFFVLSGFLIGGILLEVRESANYFRAFYIRRVFRILPIYYLWTLLFGGVVICAVTLFPGRLAVTQHDLLRIPVQLLFLQNIFIGMPHFTWTWFVVTWSLAIEEQYYLLAPPLIRFLSRRAFAAALVATILLAPLLRFMLFRYWAPGTYFASFLMPCRADALAWGMLLALAWRDERFRQRITSSGGFLRLIFVALLLGAGALLWWLSHPVNIVTVTIGYSWLAILYSAALLTAVSQRDSLLARCMRWKWLGWLGGISYCVYILHDAFNFFAHRLLLHAEPQLYNVRGVGVSLFALAVTLVVASLSWRYFEKPLIRRGHTYSYGVPANDVTG
jgi:peptidoglycan/LPS O-acetylase OafA/YrhL